MTAERTDHAVIAERFADADLERDRFVAVQDGEKACYDHDTRYSDPRRVPGTNYGVYADADDQLVVIDVDDYQDLADGGREGLKALFDLPPTLEVSTPHGGTHKPYAVETDSDQTVADVLADELGVQNPTPSWGEVQVANKYVGGAGSQLDGCSKDWCDECATDDGGRYEVSTDQAIATVDAETLVRVLAADPDVGRDSAPDTTVESDETPTLDPGETRFRRDESAGSAGFDEWLDEGLARDALEYIDAGVDYPEWRNIGFALAELFPRGTAKRLFVEWSKSAPSAWDSDAPKLADRIIDDAGSGDVSPATLVYRAKQGGWEPPSSASSTDELLAEHSDGDEPMPFWLVRQAAVELEVCPTEAFVERDSDDGETYLGFPGPQTYDAALAAIEAEGYDHGREYLTADSGGSDTDDDQDVDDGDLGDCDDDQDGRDDLPVPAAFDVRSGGYERFHPPRGDGDGDGWYERITNFQLEVLSRLTHDDGRREYRLRVYPAGGDPYVVDVEPAAFNELRTFRRDVLEGWSVTFGGGQSDLNDLKEFVADQDAPTLDGSKHIGLHTTTDAPEFVTPEGSLGPDGWLDDPAVLYTDESSQLIPLWQLDDGRDPDDVDRDAIAEILELLPETRDAERFLPVLGWFYAAPLRPYIQDWSGEFNVLNVLGDTGAGKTATLETLWRLFGMDGELLTAESTPFTMLTALASSNSLPVIFDEYKPADMNDRRKDKLHRYLRTSTKGGIESKGNADRTTDNYHLHAPVCLAGEQPIQGPAEERRSIMTTFTRDAVVGETSHSRAFAKLTGGKAAGEYHDGLPLEDHALAFYTWILRQDERDLRDQWRAARDRVLAVLDDRDVDAGVLDDTVIQGFQTVRFGCELYRAFAHEFGVNPDATPVTDDAIDDAIVYAAGEGGGADHVSHLDRFVGLLARASAAGYVEKNEHYTLVGSHDDSDPTELRIRLSTTFDQVRRYARDHDVRGEDLLNSTADYRARIRDNAENSDGYVTVTSQPTRLGDSLSRCVGIDVGRVRATVDEFELGMFTDDAERDEAERDDAGARNQSPPGVAELAPGYATFEATVKTVLDPKPWLDGEGTLRDRSGHVDYVVRDGSGSPPTLEEGETYRFKKARVTTNENDVKIVEVRPGATEVKPVTEPTRLDDHDDGDRGGDGGGSTGDDQDGVTGQDADAGAGPTARASGAVEPSGEFDGVQANVLDVLHRRGGEASLPVLTGSVAANGHTDATPDDVRSAVDRLKEKGRVITRSTDSGEPEVSVV